MDGEDPYVPIFDEGATRALYYDTQESQHRYTLYPVSETVARPGTRKSRRIESQAAVGVVPGLPVPRPRRGVAEGRPLVTQGPGIYRDLSVGHVRGYVDIDVRSAPDSSHQYDEKVYDPTPYGTIEMFETASGAVYPENEPSATLTVEGFESPITRWDLIWKQLGFK